MGERSRLRKVKIDIGWQVIDARTDNIMEFRRVIIIDVLDEYKTRPLVFAVLFCEVELADWMAIEGSLVPLNHRVVAIDSHGGMIVRDRKGKDLPVKLFLAPYKSKKFDKSSYGDGHAMRVLAIGNVESRGAALHLAGEERKVYPRCSHEIGKKLGPGLTHERLKLIQLFLCERGSPESHRVVRLWTSTLELFCVIPAFVDTFAKMIEMFSTIDS